MRFKKFGALLVSAVLCIGMAAPAFAYEGDTTPVEEPVLPEIVEEEDAVTITDEETGALTPEGNLTLVDDYYTNYSDGSGQQFITMVSKSGATFYLVIDRNAKGQQTVHFMNLVDEADLLTLMEEEDAEAYNAEKEAAKQAELDKLESLLTPANPAASDPPALPGQPPFPHQADPLPGNARPTLFDFLQACHPQAALTSLVRANTALRDQLSVALSVTQGDRVARSVETAVTDGRLSRGLVGWATALGRQNPEALETYLAAVSPIAALSSFQSTGSRPALSAPAASPLSDEERFVCAQLGLSEAEYLAVRG